MQLGIHAGSAAGAVIGKVRAFYCIYGDTVNTASRLCRYSKAGQMNCSAGFVSCLEAERAARCPKEEAVLPKISWHSRGHTLLKGFAHSIETFSVSVDGDGEAGELKKAGEAFRGSFNVDAFSSANSFACQRRGSTRKMSNDHTDDVLGVMDKHDLTVESRALLRADDMTISQRMKLSYGFDDAGIEDQYQEENALHLQHRVLAGIIVHLAGVIFQYIFTVHPDHPLEFEALGDDLWVAYQRVRSLLTVSLCVQSVISVVLGVCVKWGPVRFSERNGLLLAVLRLSWLIVSIVSSQIWPMKQYTLFFCVLYSTSQFMIISLSFRHMVVLFVVSHVLYIMCLCWLSGEMMNGAFLSRQLATSVGIWMFNVWNEDVKRRRWRLYYIFCLEMKRYQNILNDLLPTHLCQKPAISTAGGRTEPSAAAQLTLDPVNGINACLVREALVLQLDICGFTELSQKMTPMEIAQALHHIFSSFDSTVQNLSLFKMDTVGDAYVVAAWLKVSEDASNKREAEALGDDAQFNRELGHKMLWLAGAMVRDIENYRTKAQERMSVRIGMSMGKVVVGALGSLQPRLHIRGDAMRKAERLEQQGAPGMVHVCHKFIELVCGRDCLEEVDRKCQAAGAQRGGVTDVSTIDVSMGGEWAQRPGTGHGDGNGSLGPYCGSSLQASGASGEKMLEPLARAVSKELRGWDVVDIKRVPSERDVSSRPASFLLRQYPSEYA